MYQIVLDIQLLRNLAAIWKQIIFYPQQVTKWHSNPFIRGSYSYQTIQSDLANLGPSTLARPQGQGRLLFAGEATHEKYFSTVHGAIESGWREADRIICGLTEK